ncbi:MAG: DVU_1556 family methyltransferase [Syntrophorhabdales bacterium]|jgi:SAM-dependent methyltransferase
MENTEIFRAITGGWLRPGGIALTRAALALCRFQKGGVILDAGCGTGATCRRLRDDHGMAVCGVDISQSLLGGAHAQDSSLRLARASLESLPFPGATFDGILCECVLSHTAAARALEELARVLKPKGFLVLSDLYVTDPSGVATGDGADEAEVMGLDCLGRLLAGCGLRTVHFEDRTADLKRLSAELILTGCSPTDCLISAGPGSGHCVPDRPGYYLLIAEKTGERCT